MQTKQNSNLDLGLCLLFKSEDALDADALVRYARDNGWRSIGIHTSQDAIKRAFQEACRKYCLNFSQETKAPLLPHQGLLEQVLKARLQNQICCFSVTLEAGHLKAADQNTIAVLSDWLHDYGHPFYESRPTNVATIDPPAFLMQNAHASYQIYAYVPKPRHSNLIVHHLTAEVTRVEWIDDRRQLPHQKIGNKLEITLPQEDQAIGIRVMRIMLHRCEDDLPETKF